MATILLVEDDNNLREIYEARLQAEGYEIVSAHDGEEALVVAKEKKPNLIIADIMMPKISGFEMLDILKNTAGLADVKIIMLTALGQVEDQQKASKLGADRYLVKSQVTLEDIVNAAHELLEDKSPASKSEAPTSTEPAAVPPPPTAAFEPTTAAPAIDSAATPPVTPVSPASTSASVDDKLIDDAVNSLGGNVVSPAPEITQAPTSPEPSLVAPPSDPAPVDSAAPALDPAKADDIVAPNTTMPTQEGTSSEPDDTAPVSDTPTPVNGMPPDNTSPLEVSKDLEERLKQDSTEMDTPPPPSPQMTETTSTDHVPLAPPPEQSSDYLESTSGPQIESTPGSSMKIIKPIPADEKKDIGALLEQEGLSEAANSTQVVAPAESTDPDTPQVITPSGSDEGTGIAPAPSDVAL